MYLCTRNLIMCNEQQFSTYFTTRYYYSFTKAVRVSLVCRLVIDILKTFLTRCEKGFFI
jgi:hypothetical protein